VTRQVLVVRHDAADGSGAIGDALGARGVTAREVRGYEGGAVPESIGDAAALVVMGGPMSADDDRAFPFLTVEKRLIASAIAARVPVLGVCLGSQIVASVLGGRVVRAPAKEIGWHPVYRDASDPLLDLLPKTFTPFHWHEDAIVLPPGATLLARSAMTDVQAFRVGATCGLQFHLEMNAAMIETMATSFADEPREASIDPRAIAMETRAHIAAQERLATLVFGAWAEAIPA
jgi:GMP synthase (glutamine-hydrolysing)